MCDLLLLEMNSKLETLILLSFVLPFLLAQCPCPNPLLWWRESGSGTLGASSRLISFIYAVGIKKWCGNALD